MGRRRINASSLTTNNSLAFLCINQFSLCMYEFEFTIQGLPPTTNSMGRAHWAVKAKAAREWKGLVALSVGRHKPKAPLLKAKLTLTRYSSSEIDPDGLVSSFKHILDGLVFSKVIVNDKLSNIGMPAYFWHKCKKGQGKITVKIEELHEENIHHDFIQDPR